MTRSLRALKATNQAACERITCRPQDLRMHIAYLAFPAAPTVLNSFNKALSFVRQAISLLPPGRIIMLGLVKHNGMWVTTKEASKYKTIDISIVELSFDLRLMAWQHEIGLRRIYSLLRRYTPKRISTTPKIPLSCP